MLTDLVNTTISIFPCLRYPQPYILSQDMFLKALKIPAPANTVPNKPIDDVMLVIVFSIPVRESIIVPISLVLNIFWKKPVPVSFNLFNLYSRESIITDISASAFPELFDIVSSDFSTALKLFRIAATICPCLLPAIFSKRFHFIKDVRNTSLNII